MAEIDVLQTGKMLVSSAVHDRDSKSGKFAYTGLFQSKKGRNDVPVKAFLIRGAKRNPALSYPNREWGYGALNLYETFLRLREIR